MRGWVEGFGWIWVAKSGYGETGHRMRGETGGKREDVGAEGKKHRLPNTYSGFLILYLDPLQYSCLENPTDRGA